MMIVCSRNMWWTKIKIKTLFFYYMFLRPLLYGVYCRRFVNARYALWIRSSQGLCLQFSSLSSFYSPCPSVVSTFECSESFIRQPVEYSCSSHHCKVSTVTAVIYARSYNTVQTQNCCFSKPFCSELCWVSISYYKLATCSILVESGNSLHVLVL